MSCEFHPPGNVYANGRCIDCDNANKARYHRKQKLAMALLNAAESRGLSGTEAIAALQNISYRELMTCVGMGIK